MWLWIWKKSRDCIITKSHALEFTFFISEAVLLNVSILNVTELEDKACEGEWQVVLGTLMVFTHAYKMEWVCRRGDGDGQDVRTLKLERIGALFWPHPLETKSLSRAVFASEYEWEFPAVTLEYFSVLLKYMCHILIEIKIPSQNSDPGTYEKQNSHKEDT